MSQEIKNIVRTLTAANYAQRDQELSMLCKVGGWRLFNSHYIGINKVENGHDIMWILVRDVDNDGKPMDVEEPKRGRGRPAGI